MGRNLRFSWKRRLLRRGYGEPSLKCLQVQTPLSLSVLEGRVDFLDAEQVATPVGQRRRQAPAKVACQAGGYECQ